ncbi:hypothetical protein [Ruegeria halocynthiae]|uniref:hypothetical protein n=1 Tax=Ruegeria halocynthiae TaxID=985054 RepID=UPI00055CBA86|nr:hypothetical protein [Ruegeria halocynthiae]
MKPVQATLIGVVFAAALALTAQADSPEEIATRVVQAQNEQALAATWDDWHPAAEHKVTIKYGLGQKDDVFAYMVADYANLPDPTNDPQLSEALKGYEETGRSDPKITSKTTDGVLHLTAETRVAYTWQGYNGTMLQTDRFVFETQLGKPVIRSLDTTIDYR